MFRRLISILWLICLLAACSHKSTNPPITPPIEPINIVEGWPSWSPDGRYIYFDHQARDTLELFRYGEYSIWAYDIQTQKCGFFLGPGEFAKSNPDGTILAFDWGGTLFFYYFNSGTVRRVSHGIDVYEVDWAPSGQNLLLSTGDGILIDTLGNVYAHLLPWDRSNSGWYGGAFGHWFASDSILIVSSCQSPDSLRRTGILVLDTLGQIMDTVTIDDSPRADLGGFHYINMSPHRSSFVSNYTYVTTDSYSHDDFRLFNRDGTLIRIITEGAGMGKWSPDGSKIAFQKYTFMGDNPNPEDPDYGRVTPWICNPDGSDMHELLGWPQPLPDTTMFGGGYNWVTDTYNP
jgi:dipeptidyl aminopeptidase/acylaminoacyl peptidase